MSRRHVNKLLLIGWDAADWQMIRPLLDQGKMPVLARLLERGVWGNLATIRPILSPMLWNSIATGKRADKHGILGFVEPKPDATGIRPVTSTSRKCKAVWNILSQNDLTSIVVNWFASHPAEPIKGAVVTDRYEALSSCFDRSKVKFDSSMFHPRRLANALVKLHVTPDILNVETLLPFIPKAAEINQDEDDRLAKLGMLIAKNATVHTAACHLIQQEPWDFMAAYYTGIDQFGHHFMPYHPPKLPSVSDDEVRIYGQVMENCYRFHDKMLGTLIRLAGEDATIMLISDHGFHSDDDRPGPNGYVDPVGWHRPYGVVCLAGPEIKQGEQLFGGTLLDVTPTILTAFGLPIGQDMDGRPWVEVFKDPKPPERIPSWEDVEGNDGMHGASMREDTAESAEAINHLVALGYIDAPSEDAQVTVKRTIREQKINLMRALCDSLRSAKAIPLLEELIADEEQQQIEAPLVDSQKPNEASTKRQKKITSLDTFRLQLARCYLADGELEQCLTTIDHLSEEAKNDPSTLIFRAHVELSRGQLDKTLEYLYEAQKSVAGTPPLLEAFARTYLAAGKLADAEWAYESILQSDPEAVHAMGGLAQIAYQQGDYLRAAKLCLEAVGLVHNYPAAHLCLAKSLAAMGQIEQAIHAVTTTLALAPNIIEAKFLLSTLRSSANRDDKKLLHFD